jgi:hypothetical protein
VLFGQATYSTWSGYNLAKATPVMDADLARFRSHGEVSERVADALAHFEEKRQLKRSNAISAVRKAGGSLNWNHYIFVLVNPSLRDRALAWRLEHPGAWLGNAVAFYWLSTRASYTHPYTGAIRGPDERDPSRPASPLYRGFARLHRGLLFADLRPALERIWPAAVPESIRGQGVPMTLFGVVVLPLTLAAAFALGVSRWRRSRGEAAILLTFAFCIVYALALPCLTDGIEGNRFRFATGPLFTLLLLKIFEELRPPQRGTRAEIP